MKYQQPEILSFHIDTSVKTCHGWIIPPEHRRLRNDDKNQRSRHERILIPFNKHNFMPSISPSALDLLTCHDLIERIGFRHVLRFFVENIYSTPLATRNSFCKTRNILALMGIWISSFPSSLGTFDALFPVFHKIRDIAFFSVFTYKLCHVFLSIHNFRSDIDLMS